MKRLLPVVLLALTLIFIASQRTPQSEPAEVRLVIPPVTLPETVLRANPNSLVPTLADGALVTDPDLILGLNATVDQRGITPRPDFSMRCATDITICADIPAYMLTDATPQQLNIPSQLVPMVTPAPVTGLLPLLYQGGAVTGPLTVLGALPQQERARLRQALPYIQ